MNLCDIVNSIFGPLVGIPIIGGLFESFLGLLNSLFGCDH